MPIEEKKKESLPAVTDDESEDDGYVVSTTGSKTEKEEEEERDTVVASKPQKKARAVEEALIEGGWKLERSKNHLIYSRRVKIQESSETRKQNVAMAKTPSDGRASKNALALLRKLNEVLHEDEDADNSGETSECKECLKEKSNRNF